MRVRVSKGDIAKGHRYCAGSCPLANALNRAAPAEGCAWFYSVKTAWLWDKAAYKEVRKAIVPDDVAAKILAYDETGVLEPFEVDLDL